MSVCKICLCCDPANDISQLKCTENVDRSGEQILQFCLGIQVLHGSEKTTKICKTCFTKLSEFHQFKSLALKNEAILSSLGLQKYIENDIKSEVLSQASDNAYDEPLIEYSKLLEQTPLEEIPLQNHIGKHVKSRRKACSDVILEIDSKQVLNLPFKPDLEQEPSDNQPLISKETKSRDKEPIKREKSTISTPTSCNVCGKECQSRYKLRMHLETHKPKVQQKTFKCAHCNEIFRTKQMLENHIIKNHPEEVSVAVLSTKQFRCNLCPKSYCDRKNLQNHLRNDHEGFKAQCPICNKRFNESYLQTHIKARHQSETLPFKCETCGQKFANQSLLKRHVSIHTGAKPFSCDICDAKFRLKYSVALHKAQVHEKSKNHVCHICSKQYFTGSLLRRHISSHSSPVTLAGDTPGSVKREIVKRVTCPDCGKPLASAETLKHHRLLHRGEQNHCEVCGLAFATRKYVKKHMKTHTQIRKYSCKFCKNAFVRCSARRRHELEVHIKAGEKKPPKKDIRINRVRGRKTKVKEQVSTVPVSVAGQSQELGRDIPIFPISGPIKTEESTLPYESCDS